MRKELGHAVGSNHVCAPGTHKAHMLLVMAAPEYKRWPRPLAQEGGQAFLQAPQPGNFGWSLSESHDQSTGAERGICMARVAPHTLHSTSWVCPGSSRTGCDSDMGSQPRRDPTAQECSEKTHRVGEDALKRILKRSGQISGGCTKKGRLRWGEWAPGDCSAFCPLMGTLSLSPPPSL